jgi:hypothetical protein
MMLKSGTKPPSGVKLSCMPLTAPQLASVVTVANSAEFGDAEARLLAFHVAAGLGAGRGHLDAGLLQHGRAALLEVICTTTPRRNQDVMAANTAQPCRVSRTILPNV